MEQIPPPFPSHPTVGTRTSSHWVTKNIVTRGNHHFQRLPNTLAMMMEGQNDNVFVKDLLNLHETRGQTCYGGAEN